MNRTLKHGMADIDRVRAAIDGAYKANVDRLSPYSPSLVWNGARAARMSVTVMRKTITADFTITDDAILVEGKVPFMFSHFEDRIMNRLGEQLETWLAKVRPEKA
jgi:hypothetical protein